LGDAQIPDNFFFQVTGQLWSLATTTVQVRLRIQLNSILFAKTLVRKDVASSAAPKSDSDGTGIAKGTTPKPSQPTTVPESINAEEQPVKKAEDDDGDFSSKAQIMTLMTTDVDRVSEFSWHMFALVGMLPYARISVPKSLSHMLYRLADRDCHRFYFPVQTVRRIVLLRFGSDLPVLAPESLCWKSSRWRTG
jgi:hypothetical protein